ncbi:radical SAM protein [Helicobacter sp. MIT 21-1697]|uniref:radical SAM protein n=1 Tax=Helicobacter sp. MIT 21-1697 TaxID=2993733 RepID=UPI00224A78FF|nr:radical SAM protein [Helicobacter sp. MIT 21-1697]MCX2716485.1 radical SAM protein [Helicobacter sp. MIT 21-1697]
MTKLNNFKHKLKSKGKEIRHYLEDNGLKKPKPIKIDFFVFWCGTKCSLHCKNCCNLIPYMKQESFNVQEILADFAFLANYCEIKSLQIQGGELFTHPNVAQIIANLAQYKIPRISLTTNGSIVPKEELLQVLKDNPNVQITISNYDCIPQKREKLINVLEQHNIAYNKYEFMYGNGQWFDYGNVHQKRVSVERAKANYRDCDEKYCLTFADGFLYTCGKIRAINEIYGEDMRANQSDYNGISKVNVRAWRQESIGGGGLSL